MNAIIAGSTPEQNEHTHRVLTLSCPEIRILGTTTSLSEFKKLTKMHQPELILLSPDAGLAGIANGYFNRNGKNAWGVQLSFSHASDAVHVELIHMPQTHVDSAMLLPWLLKLGLTTLPIKHNTEGAKADPTEATVLSFPVKEGKVQCPVKDIIRVESDGSYSTFYLSGGRRYVVSKGLKEYERVLPAGAFFRVHRSHLVNVSRIRNYAQKNGDFVETEDGALIEIARRKKNEFLKRMSSTN